jgi:hypothetical protein
MSGSYFGHRQTRRKTKFFSLRSFAHMGIVVSAPLSMLYFAWRLARKISRL